MVDWGLLTIAVAVAQAAAPPGDTIIVTGERQRRTVRDTASSVAIFTARDIAAEAGADRIDQLLELTPNVTVGTSNLGPTIRGQNSTGALQDLPAFLGGNRQRVTLQVDGRAVSFNEFVFGAAPLWDVAQVEIFRSPQSTTQGRNSIAGAIFIETEDPAYELLARGRLIYGEIAMHQVSAAVSGPLIGDQLAFRLSGDLRHGRPASEIGDDMVGADPNNDDYGLVRLKLLLEPEALPGLRIEASAVHAESKMPQVEGVRVPFEERRDPFATYGVFGTRTDSLTIRANHEFSPALRTATTIAFGDSRFQRFAPEGLGEAINLVKDWSIEQTVDWRPSPAIELVAGVHHLRTRLDQEIDLTRVLGNGTFDDKQTSTGLFGDVEVRPLAKLKLSAGVRYQTDSQRRIGALVGPGITFPLDYDERFEALLPKFSVAYDVLPSLTVGALVQRAYNPGGATINFDTGEPETFGAEFAWSYELFARASIGRARIGANLFRTDFRDAQRAQSRAYTVPGRGTAFWAEIENVPRSRSSGAELSLDWPVTDRLRLGGGLGLLRTRITRTADPANPINGREFQRAPHATASGSIEWLPLDGVQLNASLRHHSRYFSSDRNEPALLIEGNSIANARAAWSRGRFTLFGYARNIFDTFYMSHLGSTTFGTAVDPRELGVGLEARF
ncbi:MAG TPA: TonB-dependent receptor [Sphingomicrobium sp.]